MTVTLDAAATVEKIGLHLSVGDVIVAPDGARHTVTDVYSWAPHVFEFTTDTGQTIKNSWDGAKYATYDVLAEPPAFRLINAVGRQLTPAEEQVLAHLNAANDSAVAASFAAPADAAGCRDAARRHRAIARSLTRRP